MDLSWLEVSQLKGELRGGPSSGVLSRALCPCGGSAGALGMDRKCLVQLGLVQTDQFKPYDSKSISLFGIDPCFQEESSVLDQIFIAKKKSN